MSIFKYLYKHLSEILYMALFFATLSSLLICFSEKRSPSNNNKVQYLDKDNHVFIQPKCNCALDNMNNKRKLSLNRVVNQLVTDYRQDLANRFQKTVDNNCTGDDPEVVSLVREMLDAPSTHMPKDSVAVIHTPQSEYVTNHIFKTQRGGFFVECGAMDGERSSNTLWIEQNLKWNGLLIEADPYFYTQLLGKNRRAWSINACLSPSKYTRWLNFAEDSGGKGMIKAKNNGISSGLKVPCFPLLAMMLALNRTSVDYFSLDVEGQEINILQSIAHDKTTIRVWSVEYDKVGEGALTKYMESSGYERVTKIDKVDYKVHIYSRDLIFRKK